ncbi:flagellar motor switch protein [Tepidicaulis marinus]|uniref:Flagellar motor switch protein FliG n=1 Tax=Tepidicaulis marinus TaxID=1333998 RepID=A0A081BB43_9HYPH|nr:flagellar motor switch protein FliG [Tepidicaulis marinus]GAK45261.1 flagellar motor switch protein [Tepidicaulis marinus]
MEKQIRLREDVTSLTGPERAAVILFALGKDRGAKLMEQLDEDEIRMVSRSMAQLGSITSSVCEHLLRDFTDYFVNSASVVGTYDSTERMLSQFLPEERVMEIMGDIRGAAGRSMWEKLSTVNEQILASYLQSEHPQTAAVILSKIRSAHAARVVAALPSEFRADVMRRMIEMDYVQKDVLKDIEETLHSEFMVNYARMLGNDSHMRIADILNQVDRARLPEIMGEIEQEVPDSADAIKALMFTFDDLLKLDGRSIQVIVQAVEIDTLILALKGLKDEAREIVFQNMSERARAIVKGELELMGAIRASDVDEAQSRVLRLAKELEARGEIILNQQGKSSPRRMIA